jgi:hypothetical protein
MPSERTRLNDLARVGCRFEVGVELHPADIVSIRQLVPGSRNNVAANQLLLFEIIWSAQRGIRWSTGARKLEGEKLVKANILIANCASRRTEK